MTNAMKYESNPKHKEPWHHGKSGTLCPRWSWSLAQDLLKSSEQIGKTRYAVRDGVAFQGHEHEPGKWHGHPVAWNEVNQKLVNRWIQEKRVSRREVRKSWSLEDLDSVMRGDAE